MKNWKRGDSPKVESLENACKTLLTVSCIAQGNHWLTIWSVCIALHEMESSETGHSGFESDLRSDFKVRKSYYQCRVTGIFNSFQSVRSKYKTNATGVKSTSEEENGRTRRISVAVNRAKKLRNAGWNVCM